MKNTHKRLAVIDRLFMLLLFFSFYLPMLIQIMNKTLSININIYLERKSERAGGGGMGFVDPVFVG